MLSGQSHPTVMQGGRGVLATRMHHDSQNAVPDCTGPGMDIRPCLGVSDAGLLLRQTLWMTALAMHRQADTVSGSGGIAVAGSPWPQCQGPPQLLRSHFKARWVMQTSS